MDNQRRKFRITPIDTVEQVDLTISTSIRRQPEEHPATVAETEPISNLQRPELPRKLPEERVATDGIPASLMNLLQESMTAKITEMVKVHKELVLEMLKKDQEGEQRIRDLVSDITQLNRENTSLHIENQKLKEVLSCRHN